jgi:SAM-dependent methyltransferase
MRNRDDRVVHDFGREWSQFDQTGVASEELERSFERYFSLFPWNQLPSSPEGFDLGCGSGRWAYYCAQRVGRLHCIEPSEAALAVAAERLTALSNCALHLADVDTIPLADNSMDFGYSLGVLHHVPDTARGIRSCVRKLKPNAPFLLYLYYAFDNRPWWFKGIWRVSDLLRRVVSALPYPLKYLISQVLAVLVYLPLARLARGLARLGVAVNALPLSGYRDKSLYTMRTDALDRFGTRLERRFTKLEIERMMRDAGLDRIRFSDQEPFWCAMGYRAAS